MGDLGVHVDLHQLAAVPIAHDPLLEHGWTGANGHVALLLRVALLEVGLAGVLLLELITHCALTPLLLRLTGSEHGLVSLLGVVLDRGDLFQVDRLGRELHSEELGLLSDDAPHPAVTERQAVAPLVLLAWRA